MLQEPQGRCTSLREGIKEGSRKPETGEEEEGKGSGSCSALSPIPEEAPQLNQQLPPLPGCSLPPHHPGVRGPQLRLRMKMTRRTLRFLWQGDTKTGTREPGGGDLENKEGSLEVGAGNAGARVG